MAAVETLGSIVDHGRVEHVPLIVDALRSKQKGGKYEIKKKIKIWRQKTLCEEKEGAKAKQVHGMQYCTSVSVESESA